MVKCNKVVHLFSIFSTKSNVRAFVFPTQIKILNINQVFSTRSNTANEFRGGRTNTFPKITSLCESTTNEIDINLDGNLSSKIEIQGIDAEDAFERYPNRTISACVSAQLPFSTSIAFDAFSDLSRQPSWAPWLSSVVYLDNENFKNSKMLPTNHNAPGRETKWTIRVKGVNFSWKAISTQIERPHLISWESTSGLRNRGKVQFIKETQETCEMNIAMSFVMPRLLVKIFQKSNFVRNFFTEKMLGGMLKRFRYVVMTEDLGIKLNDTFEDFNQSVDF